MSLDAFGQVQNNTGPSISNTVGVFQLDHAEYDVSNVQYTSVKAFGIVNVPHDGGRITIVFTSPSGDITGARIFINGTDGHFETIFPLYYNSEKGVYHVLASYDTYEIGSLDFSVKEIPVKETPLTNSSSNLPKNMSTINKNMTNSTNEISQPINQSVNQLTKPFSNNINTKPSIVYYITQLSLDYKESTKTGYINVYPKLTTNSGGLLSSNNILIHIDGQTRDTISANAWSVDIWTGADSHTVEATYPQTVDPNNSNIIYKGSDITKIIFLQTKITNPVPASIPSNNHSNSVPTTTGNSPTAYVVAGIVLAIVIAIVSVIVLKRTRNISKIKTTPSVKSTSSRAPSTDDTQFYGCPHCGGDTKMRYGKQYCDKCKTYL
jgi:hypothetical protein